MGKSLKDNPCGGNMGECPVHFHEDGPFAVFSAPTSASKTYSDVYDLGESLSGICIRGYADEALAGGSAVVTIYGGNTKTAAGTDTAAWTAIATATASTAAAAGDKILEYVPAPGDSYKYYIASIQGGTGVSAGKVSVWNELVP